MSTGKINVQTENIFPIIKKFLYSDHEIFLRELVSNSVDATQKLKTLLSAGEFKDELGNINVEVSFDSEKKTITVLDRGIGMTSDELEKYINQIAFSGAEEFLEKYKNQAEGNAIIGHFGLGFYSAFMVSDRVEIHTKSYKENSVAVKWECTGSPEYTLSEIDKQERGTEIILHISSDAEEFLDEQRLKGILNKYCKFLPVPICFGEEEITEKDADGKEIKIKKPKQINNPKPAWTQKPADLKEEDYQAFYKELYPYSMDNPLFNIHLNVDYPFNLTGILYFPKVKKNFEFQRDKIQLYCNQVFVTDSVEGIVPDFLTLLHGVIDSPDIPLNVSRSYLQSDSNVKKISSHISKKVADRLEEIFKNKRDEFESKWDDIKIFIEYGIISDEKFYERAKKFCMFKNIEGKYFTFEEYEEHIKVSQTDKDNKIIYLYTTNQEEQHSYIQAAKERGYDVLLLDGQIDTHFINNIEHKLNNASFVRVDADIIDKLIKKTESIPSKLSDKECEELRPVFGSYLEGGKYYVMFESLSETDNPVMITKPEFMRRMKEMSALGGGASIYGNLPDQFNIVVNSNHPVINNINKQKDEKLSKELLSLDSQIKPLNEQLAELRNKQDASEEEKTKTHELETKTHELEEQKTKMLEGFGKENDVVKQLIDLALLSQNMLKGEDLTKFIKRSLNIIKA
ncbi:MAG: molecular chaperone HtpG [Bacteroidetes bacterium GWE2_29_8]|nr:MAG: molecular chaperone HtpG [Bacteroidetes bacterium GWE2_29_8]OFY24859.1 MAG: molecular chaperone HtpG [Bacteroidetes bacterium GWF2_29_10]